MFERLGHFIFRHRKAVILIWCLLLVVGAVLAPMAMDVLAPGSNHTNSGEAIDGYRVLEQEFGIRPAVLTVVFGRLAGHRGPRPAHYLPQHL